MTQQISKQMGEFEERLQEIMGVDEREAGRCDKHGDYINVHYSGRGKHSEGWHGCPECADEETARKSRQEDIERQAAMQRERVERTVKKSGIPPRFTGKTFENFQAVNRKAESHLAKLQAYAELVSGDDHEGRCLLMLGKVGNGKTHLGCALLAQTIRATAEFCAYWTFAELVRGVKGSFSKDAGYSEQDVYDDFARPRLVVLDEVGIQNFTEFEQAVAYEAINARYLAEKPTVLISNLQAKDLPQCVGERVVDRLREGGGKALDFDWKSFRQGGAA